MPGQKIYVMKVQHSIFVLFEKKKKISIIGLEHWKIMWKHLNRYGILKCYLSLDIYFIITQIFYPVHFLMPNDFLKYWGFIS